MPNAAFPDESQHANARTLCRAPGFVWQRLLVQGKDFFPRSLSARSKVRVGD